jgi:hypothetical protein
MNESTNNPILLVNGRWHVSNFLQSIVENPINETFN